MLICNVPLRIKRRGVEMRLVIEGPSSAAANRDPTLLKEIRRAHRCFEALVSGRVRSVAELATEEGINDRYVSALLPSPCSRRTSSTRLPRAGSRSELTAHRLIRAVDLPIAWAAQKQLLGIP